MKTRLDLRRWAQQAHCNKTQSQPSTSAVRSTHTLTPILSLSLALAGKLEREREREWEKRRPKHTFWLTPFRRSSSIYRAKSLLLCENKHFFFSFQFRFYPSSIPRKYPTCPSYGPIHVILLRWAGDGQTTHPIQRLITSHGSSEKTDAAAFSAAEEAEAHGGGNGEGWFRCAGPRRLQQSELRAMPVGRETRRASPLR